MTEPEAGRRPIRRLREVLVYDNPYARIFDDEVEFPDGAEGRYLRVETPGEGLGVVVLPVHAGTVGLVRTFRYSVDAWQWGLPRGFSQDTDPLVTAKAELQEELGIQAGSLDLLGTFSPDSGLLSREVAVVLATIDDPTGVIEDVREVAASRWVAVTALWDEVAQGRLVDGMTLAALALATARGSIPGPA